MRKSLALVALAGLLAASPILAIVGISDRVPAATLVVPFFEVGINVAVNVEDTLLVVWNTNSITSTRVHYQVWDIDGVPVFNGNLTLAPGAGWNTSMRDLITPLSSGVKTALTVGSFYRGFVTFDVVTTTTSLPPSNASYPFGASNVLEGYIYYVRLLEGSANGLSMIPIESVPASTDSFLSGFYQSGDDREEIDSTARSCAAQLASGGSSSCAGDNDIYRLRLRVFGSVPLTGSTRYVIFTWTTGHTGGPSVLCAGGGCDTSYAYKLYDDAGTIVTEGLTSLPHVVNVFSLAPDTPGFLSIWNIPSFAIDTQIYGFVFNSAAPAGNPLLTWDAIFEAFINP